MLTAASLRFSIVVALAAIVGACSSNPASQDGGMSSGGSSRTGSVGSGGTGGASVVSGKGGGLGGDAPGTGGMGSGGAGMGGAGRGGSGGASMSASGGSTATGGSTQGAGGARTGGFFGARDGGLDGGGVTGTGGISSGSGGSATGGLATGGATSSGGGGSTRDAGLGASTGTDAAQDTKQTAGCGSANFPASGKYTIDVGGTQRSYIIKLPTGFDNTKPFRLVMTWHGLGGSAERTANAGYEGSYYGLEPLSNGQAIFTSGQGLSDSMGTGWANTNDQDVKFVKALVEYLRKTYCLDDTRIFSVGKSYGGLFSNTLGCEMGDVFRGIAPQSSWLPSPLGTCVGQPAVFIDHGNTDTTIDFSRGKAARDLWLKTNHCAATTKPWDQPDTTCVAYDGCDADKPVVWCEFDGGHVMPSWASAAVWKFLMQF